MSFSTAESFHVHGFVGSGRSAIRSRSTPPSEYLKYALSGRVPRTTASNVTSLCRSALAFPGTTFGSINVLVAGRRGLEGQRIRSSDAENVFQLRSAERNATAQTPIAATATRVNIVVFATSLGCTRES